MDTDPLSGLGLHPVTLSDQARFSHFFAGLADPLSDYTFAQVFTWGNSLRIFWREIHGHLCVFANGTGDLTLLMPPIGDGNGDRALREAFEIMDAYNAAHNAVGRSRVEYVSDELLARFASPRLVASPMGADYLYDVNRMIDLAGGDLASKRQLRNRFLRNYEARVEPYDPSLHRAACVNLLRSWKQHQDEQRNADGQLCAIKRHKESLACELALGHSRELELQGLVVYVRSRPDASLETAARVSDWSLRGFTLGERLGGSQSSILIEKTDLEVRGLAQFIFSEFCRRSWSGLPWVNAGDDWGLQTLAWTKLSYRPVKLLQKYELRLAHPAQVAVPDMTSTPPASVPALAAEPLPVPTVRTARKEDMSAAIELEQRCFSAHCFTKRQLQYLQASPSARFLVAEQDGRLLGQGISLVRRHRRSRSGRIYSLAVGVEHRGRKIGQKLLRAMMRDLIARGVSRIYLEVEEGNTAAIRLYEQNGFRRVDLLPDYYGKGKAGLHMVCDVPAATEPASR